MRTFFLAASCLSLTLLAQYLLVWFRSHELIDRQIARAFSLILLFRTLVLLIGGLFNTSWGRAIALVGIIISWWLPSLTGKYTKQHPIIFSHLLERLTLLIIITFGETIIGIADYFKPTTFSVSSVFVFAIVAALFFAYITEFDHLIEEKRKGETGNRLIYLHYLILFGLSLVTVSLKFISEDDANMTFALSCLYGGMLLFYLGLTIAIHYNRPQFRQINWTNVAAFVVTLAVGYAICLFTRTLWSITFCTAIVSVFNAGMKVRLLYQ